MSYPASTFAQHRRCFREDDPTSRQCDMHARYRLSQPDDMKVNRGPRPADVREHLTEFTGHERHRHKGSGETRFSNKNVRAISEKPSVRLKPEGRAINTRCSEDEDPARDRVVDSTDEPETHNTGLITSQVDGDRGAFTSVSDDDCLPLNLSVSHTQETYRTT